MTNSERDVILDLVLRISQNNSHQPIYLAASEVNEFLGTLPTSWRNLTEIVTSRDLLQRGLIASILGVEIRAAQDIPKGFAYLPGYAVPGLGLVRMGYSPDPAYLYQLAPRTLWQRLLA